MLAPETPDVGQVFGVFMARMAGGYAICAGLLGPSVAKGPWRSVSLFVITALAAGALLGGAPALPCIAVGVGALLVQRALAFGLPPMNMLWVAPLGAALITVTEWPPGPSAFLGAVASGGTLAAMLLGHSYLTARGLSFAPFRRMAWLLLIVLALRATSVAPAFFVRGVVPMDLVYLGVRTCLGLLVPLLLGWMVVECVRIESNQSATGILYAMTVLVCLFGELPAVYLALVRGIPA